MADRGKEKKKKKSELREEDTEMEMEEDIPAGLPPSVQLARTRVVCGAHFVQNVRLSHRTQLR